MIIAALIHYDIAEKMQTIPFNEVKFMGSIGVTFFAFAGYVITNAAGDVKNPQRTITWGIFLTILIVIGLYLALAFVALHFIPAQELMANADIAVAVAANRLMGDWGYALMYITAVIAFISGIGATYFSIFSNLICLSPATYSSGILSPSVLATGNVGKSAHCVADAGGNAVV